MISVHGFANHDITARELADCLKAPYRPIDVHKFPDGESLITVPGCARTAIVFQSLDHPNDKLVDLLFSAGAFRDRGAENVMLVAPYLAYMRQDKAFAPGQAVSQKIFGSWLAESFSSLVTVSPHLHRVRDLDQVFPGINCKIVPATPIYLRLIGDVSDNPVLFGPDEESLPQLEALAQVLSLDYVTGVKVRHGDRNIDLTIPDAIALKGRRVIIVDDVISSGTTIARSAELLKAAGSVRVDVAVMHALFDDTVSALLHRSGVERIASAESIIHPTNATGIAADLASTIEEMLR